jgi:hypothetical protein
MPDIKFGASQLKNPTPSHINLWVKVFTVAGTAFIGWMATNTMVGPNSKNIINSILGLALTLINVIAPLFGVDINTKTVPSSEVTAIDTDKLTDKKP